MKNKDNRHHIYPKSRFPRIKNNPKNIARIGTDNHALYHLLFKNRTPEEVIKYLNIYYWNNSFEITLIRKW